MNERERAECRERLATATRIHDAAHAADCLCTVHLTPSGGRVLTSGTHAAIARLRELLPGDLARSAVIHEESAGVSMGWTL